MAAGTSERFGRGEPKQFRPLNGYPALAWSVKKFSELDAITAIVIVITPGLEEKAAELVETHRLGKVYKIVAGGETRQESVRLGLEALSDSVEYTLVHDAARPCVSGALIGRVCDALATNDAVVPTVPVVDTLVMEIDGTVDAIIDRSRIAGAQTPQGFRRSLLVHAHRRAASRGFLSSDDGSLVLAMGEPVKTVPGEQTNIKITHREDLKLAEAILASATPPNAP